jgi:hypothetical protein
VPRPVAHRDLSKYGLRLLQHDDAHGHAVIWAKRADLRYAYRSMLQLAAQARNLILTSPSYVRKDAVRNPLPTVSRPCHLILVDNVASVTVPPQAQTKYFTVLLHLPVIVWIAIAEAL